MIGAKLMCEGKMDGIRVWNMEQMDPDAFMENMNEYGLPFKVIEEPGFDLILILYTAGSLLKERSLSSKVLFQLSELLSVARGEYIPVRSGTASLLCMACAQ